MGDRMKLCGDAVPKYAIAVFYRKYLFWVRHYRRYQLRREKKYQG
jgi:hypothetical protein